MWVHVPQPGQRRPAVLRSVARWSLFCGVLLAFILVPFFVFEGQVSALVEENLRSDRSMLFITLAVIAFLLADIALPIPSSFVLASTGFLLGAVLGTAVCFIGMTCASLGGYALGRYAGGPLAQRIVGRAELERFEGLSSRFGDALLVAFRAMPVLAEATTILAGTSRMPLPRFLAVVSIGNLVVSLLYASLGAVSASQSSFLLVFVAAIGVPVLIVLAMHWASRSRVLR